ncbi:hypothetical protein DEALK_07630 [Dehalogenimonas alkenigignens]|uniref:Uncharacterized protein n=1 Tax=Dehalogenimonas alkenigignens TaxID=1217799 RepID=A0A0W0GH79_9CHLR|nr:hypothetical protein DEALK_07630 [Dehalogenimonas alkenigignens]
MSAAALEKTKTGIAPEQAHLEQRVLYPGFNQDEQSQAGPAQDNQDDPGSIRHLGKPGYHR